jgi:hypothetical protein
MSKRDKINDCRSNYLDLVIILYHNFNKNTRNFFPRWDDRILDKFFLWKKYFIFSMLRGFSISWNELFDKEKLCQIQNECVRKTL